MLRYIHLLSAIVFFCMAGSLFGAYLLIRYDIASPWPEQWLLFGDLPMLLSGLLYGGLCIEQSVQTSGKRSLLLSLTIGVVLFAIFFIVAALNFWKIIP